MRLWSIHRRYLDPAGLTAVWREAILARLVLLGRTRGYRHHPQLARFREHGNAVAAINAFLDGLHSEACRRRYAFDCAKVGRTRSVKTIAVTSGQLAFEWRHPKRKLRTRNPFWVPQHRARPAASISSAVPRRGGSRRGLGSGMTDIAKEIDPCPHR